MKVTENWPENENQGNSVRGRMHLWKDAGLLVLYATKLSNDMRNGNFHGTQQHGHHWQFLRAVLEGRRLECVEKPLRSER